MGFRHWLWLGPFRTITFLFFNHSCIALALCLVLPKHYLFFISFSFFANWNRFSWNMYHISYFPPSILPLIWTKCTSTWRWKSSHSLMLPPPYFTVGIVWFEAYGSHYICNSHGALNFSQKSLFPLIRPQNRDQYVIWVIVILSSKL